MVDLHLMGNRILRERASMGMTQEQTAKALGISLSYYGNIERGKRMPSLAVLISIANLFKTGIDLLVVDSLVLPDNDLLKERFGWYGNMLVSLPINLAALQDWNKDESGEQK